MTITDEMVKAALTRYYTNEDEPMDSAMRAALEAVAPMLVAQGMREAAGYAERLAVALWEKHYKHDAPHWKPLSGDIIGILTQIDNMTSGLVRAQELDPK